MGSGAGLRAWERVVILLPRAVRVYFAVQPVSLRRSFDGLSNEVRSVLRYDPLTGHVFVFLNRRKTQVKLLIWTRGGYTIVHNQRSSHYTSFDFRREICFFVADVRMAAARSTSRSQRL